MVELGIAVGKNRRARALLAGEIAASNAAIALSCAETHSIVSP
jgi:hypothetical protein